MHRPLAVLTKYLNDDLNESLYSEDRSPAIINLKYRLVPEFWHLINDIFQDLGDIM